MKRMKLLATSFLALSLGPVGVVLATHPDSLEIQTQNGIDYVAGGIGKEQSEVMKVAAHDYDLMLTFATDGGKYLADIGILDAKTGKIEEVPLGQGSAPHGVIVGPDGAPWITDSGQNAIVRVEPQDA